MTAHASAQTRDRRNRHTLLARVIAATLLASSASPAAACDRGAAKVIELIYKSYENDLIFNIAAPDIYSARLQPIIKDWNSRCETNPEAGGCVLDGDFFIDGNDFKLSQLRITCLSGDEQKSRVLVTFKNFDTPSKKVFDMVKEGDRWLIDEIADDTEGKGFLGEIFKAP